MCYGPFKFVILRVVVSRRLFGKSDQNQPSGNTRYDFDIRMRIITILVKNLAYMYSNAQVPCCGLADMMSKASPTLTEVMTAITVTGNCAAVRKLITLQRTALKEESIEHG